jgi:hypothetical protein
MPTCQDAFNLLLHQPASVLPFSAFHEQFVVVCVFVADVGDNGQFDGVRIERAAGGRTAHPTAAPQSRVLGYGARFIWRTTGELVPNRFRDCLDEPDVFGLSLDHSLRSATSPFGSVFMTFSLCLSKGSACD